MSWCFRGLCKERTMKTITLGSSGLEVSQIAQGCMRMTGTPAEAVAAVRAGLEQGINFFDHADVYGGGRSEELFSAVWDEVPGLRDRILLQSKCGIRSAGSPDKGAPKRYDFSYEHIMRSVDGSLSRLRTDYLDVLLLHRPDPLVEPEEVARAFDELQQAGKVRHFGVSNQTPAQMRLLQRWVDQPLVANQVEISITQPALIADAVFFNRDDAPGLTSSEGTLEFCRLEGISVQAWSPLAGGTLTGKPLASPDARLEGAAAAVTRAAEEHGVSGEAIALAWLLKHPAQIQPIVGTTNPSRIAQACQAFDVVLSREEWYSLLIAGIGRELP
jgi:predicted oxidoreductase